METQILIANHQKRIPLNPNRITRFIKNILKSKGVLAACLSVVFVTDRKIKALNRKFLKRNHATDVLAFDFGVDRVRRFRRASRRPKEIYGEIVISTDTVFKNAKIFHTTSRRELDLCVIHGIRHLLGYDVHGAKDIKRMRRKEQELLKLIKP